MKTNKIEQFNTLGEALFRRLSDDFGYLQAEITVAEINGEPWSAQHIYINSLCTRKIVIKQAPYHTDYGFSFFIYNLENGQYNIVYHVPHERQDENGRFLSDAARDIFSSDRIMNLIKGGPWEELEKVYFQR